MIIVTGAMVARPDAFETLLELCLAHVTRSRKEPGCLSHAVYIDPENPLRLVFFEEWASRDALETHFRDPESRGFVRDSRQFLSGGTRMKLYEAEYQPEPAVGSPRRA